MPTPRQPRARHTGPRSCDTVPVGSGPEVLSISPMVFLASPPETAAARPRTAHANGHLPAPGGQNGCWLPGVLVPEALKSRGPDTSIALGPFSPAQTPLVTSLSPWIWNLLLPLAVFFHSEELETEWMERRGIHHTSGSDGTLRPKSPAQRSQSGRIHSHSDPLILTKYPKELGTRFAVQAAVPGPRIPGHLSPCTITSALRRSPTNLQYEKAFSQRHLLAQDWRTHTGRGHAHGH
ncbi:Zinc finger protein 554 [Heterocephalus glaber]|uniref:Zinc finger protein 554 n=1 Tax=Heterocephalus glaber TaxID=10181 RepID=G5AKQ6_HETGA|nr:Zinc finger protein 554 [Heterocephalus glaber]